jgi:septal ring factor EnvC (AmiA/AmiB activator)
LRFQVEIAKFDKVLPAPLLVLTLCLLVLHMLQEGSPPDVWLQLLLRCMTDPICQLAVEGKIAHELTAHKSLTLQQQQQLSTQQQLLPTQQQQLSAQLQQLSAHEQQLSAQEELVAAQQRLITDLQEQLSAQQHAASEQVACLQGQVHELHAAVQQLLSHRQP